MVTCITIVPRDQALDSELESGAHMTLILIATGLAFLFTATVIIFYLFPLCRLVRRKLFLQSPVGDSSQVQKLTNKTQVFRPTMTSTPLRQMRALPQGLDKPSYQPELGTISTQRYPAFFTTRIPGYPVPLVPRPNASYNIPTPGFYNHRSSPPNQSHLSHYHHPHLATLPPPLPITIVSPHIAGWMKVADDVVGSHPFSKPLFERVASQAETDLISGHVHIGWTHNARRSRPMLVTVLGPAHDAQKRYDHIDHSPSTRGRFNLRDEGPNRFEQLISPSTAPGNDSTAKPKYKAVALMVAEPK